MNQCFFSPGQGPESGNQEPAPGKDKQSAHQQQRDPGSLADEAETVGDMDGGGGISAGTETDPELDHGDMGPTPNKVDQ